MYAKAMQAWKLKIIMNIKYFGNNKKMKRSTSVSPWHIQKQKPRYVSGTHYAIRHGILSLISYLGSIPGKSLELVEKTVAFDWFWPKLRKPMILLWKLTSTELNLISWNAHDNPNKKSIALHNFLPDQHQWHLWHLLHIGWFVLFHLLNGGKIKDFN